MDSFNIKRHHTIRRQTSSNIRRLNRPRLYYSLIPNGCVASALMIWIYTSQQTVQASFFLQNLLVFIYFRLLWQERIHLVEIKMILTNVSDAHKNTSFFTFWFDSFIFILKPSLSIFYQIVSKKIIPRNKAATHWNRIGQNKDVFFTWSVSFYFSQLSGTTKNIFRPKNKQQRQC